MTTKRVLAAAAVAAVLAGCSSGGQPAGDGPSQTAAPATVVATAAPITPTTTVPPATTTTLSLASFAKRYLAIVAPANAQFAKLDAVDSNADVPAALLAAVTAADQQADNALLRVAWPTPTIIADVKALVSADGVLIGDLQTINDQTTLSSATYENQLNTDGGKDAAAANIVRADLGLPPTPSS